MKKMDTPFRKPFARLKAALHQRKQARLVKPCLNRIHAFFTNNSEKDLLSAEQQTTQLLSNLDQRNTEIILAIQQHVETKNQYKKGKTHEYADQAVFKIQHLWGEIQREIDRSEKQLLFWQDLNTLKKAGIPLGKAILMSIKKIPPMEKLQRELATLESEKIWLSGIYPDEFKED